MDKSWIKITNRAEPAYIRGVDIFLDWAFTQSGVKDMIRCLCKGCMITAWKVRSCVRADLLKKGIAECYNIWDCHGESHISAQTPFQEGSYQGHTNSDEEDDLVEMLHDAYGGANPPEFNSDSTSHEQPNV